MMKSSKLKSRAGIALAIVFAVLSAFHIQWAVQGIPDQLGDGDVAHSGFERADTPVDRLADDFEPVCSGAQWITHSRRYPIRCVPHAVFEILEDLRQ